MHWRIVEGGRIVACIAVVIKVTVCTEQMLQARKLVGGSFLCWVSVMLSH